MPQAHPLTCLGYASGIAAPNPGTCMGPLIAQNLDFSQAGLQPNWAATLYAKSSERGFAAVSAVAEISTRLAEYTFDLVRQKSPYLIMGGDHSCAIGNWSGAASALRPQGALGLIWVDAHMDAHTFATTPSNNIHGMPVAVLLGHGEPELTKIMGAQPKLQPQHICLIGVRSFESGEAKLLQDSNVRVYFMEEVKQRGLNTVMQEALQIVNQGTAGYGISIDLDGIDPCEAPGVGSPEPDGLHGQELIQWLQTVNADPRLVGLEIAEFNPQLDQNHLTERLIYDLIRAVYGKT